MYLQSNSPDFPSPGTRALSNGWRLKSLQSHPLPFVSHHRHCPTQPLLPLPDTATTLPLLPTRLPVPITPPYPLLSVLTRVP